MFVDDFGKHAGFDELRGPALDAQGKLHVDGRDNHSIRKVAAGRDAEDGR